MGWWNMTIAERRIFSSYVHWAYSSRPNFQVVMIAVREHGSIEEFNLFVSDNSAVVDHGEMSWGRIEVIVSVN